MRASGLQMIPGCNEPSSVVAFMGFRHNLIGYELALA
jgi:hypothetical protein